MAINLGNVNISLRQFQDISSGTYNAGEVKLTSETGIGKVNNHVTMKFLNTTKISHVEVLAIKNAFVKALKSGGVGADEINRIRQELGLAPMKPVDRSLHERSIKPLSRQQIREILDRNAGAINDHEGAGTIRTSQEIHANVSERTQASRNAEREAVNAELNTRRDIVENRQINKIQAVLAGDVDFVPFADRKELLEMARRCLDAALADCHGRPRDDFRPAIHWTAPGGKEVALSTGLTEKELVRKLEDIIVRLGTDKAPTRDQLAIRDEFKALATPKARTAWVANLANDLQGAFKARVVAVMIMHDRGIDDAATLSVVNRLKNADAIQFAANLVSGDMNFEGEALRTSLSVERALADADPHANVPTFEKAYIPALSDNDFNKQICFNMVNHPEKLPATFRMLVDEATSEVRARYGAVGYPDNANASYLKQGDNLSDMIGLANPNAPRITTEALRDNYIRGALAAGAERVVHDGVGKRLKAAGIAVDSTMVVSNAVICRDAAIMQRVLAAESLEAADAVLDDYIELIVVCGKRTATTERCCDSIGDLARSALAKKLGVPAASLSGQALSVEWLDSKANDLTSAINNGENPVDSEDDIKAEFQKLVDKFVNERVQVLAKIDDADISAEAKIAFKTSILKMNKVNYLDIDEMIASAKNISAANLAGLLADNAPKARIFDAMRDITAAVTTAMNRMFAAARQAGKEIGVDEKSNFIDPMIKLVVLSKPGLSDMLGQFLTSPAMAEEHVYSIEVRHPALNFMVFEPDPGANAHLASKLGTDEFPAFHTKALMEAVREEGLGELTAAETLALFKPGQPTGGSLLKTAIMKSGRDVSPTMLKGFARTAIRACKQAILAMQKNKADVEAAERSFLAGNGAQRARETGYHASELPRLAKAFALYKVATNCTDDVALADVLNPASKASRLMNYGGRFTESAESFRAGLALMDKFSQWYANVAQAVKDGKLDTPTQVNATKDYMPAEALRGYEMFVFQDLAIRPDVNLEEQEPENLFGIGHNDAVNFFSRGNGSGCTGMLMRLPPAKRQVVYAAFKAIEAPMPENPGKELTSVNNAPWYLARILRNYDQVADLAANGNLDRTHLNKILAPDLDLPDDATSQQVNDIIQNRLFEKYGESPDKFSMASEYVRNGYTITEIVDAVDNGRKLDRLPEMSPTEMKIEAIDGTTRGGRELMLADLCRPMQLSYAGSDIKIPPVENNHFTVTIGDETIRCATGGPQSNANVAEKIEAFCGTVHIEQANSVMRGLSQAAHLALTPILAQYGISTRQSEHMALTYTLTKNDETGAVTIRYSEPAGFPFKFSWETSVALDGASTTTPIVVDADHMHLNEEHDNNRGGKEI